MFDGLLSAFLFLTTLPVGWLARGSALSAAPGKMFAFFPLVGLVIGVIVSAVASITFLPKDVLAVITLIVWVALTGGLHLDGLADSCDGLLATTSQQRRLEIMADPRAGSWAVIGIVLVLLGKWAAIRNLPPAALIVVPVAGRWAMVQAVAFFPNVKTSGLAASFRVGFGRAQLLIATLISVVVIVVFSYRVDEWMMALIVIVPLAVWIAGRWAAQRLGGGLTGDVYGAICEVVELLCLLYLTIGRAA